MVKKYSFLFIIVASVLWSLDGVLRRNLYSLPPTIIVLYEHIIGLIILFPFVIKDLHLLKQLRRKDLLSLLWVGLLSGVLGTLMYTAALGQINYIQYSVVVLLQQIEPLFALIFARVLLREQVTRKYLIWAIPAVVSAYLISFPNFTINFTKHTGEVIAALLALGAAFAWGSSTAFSRFVLKKIPFQVATAVRFGFTIPIAFGFVLLTGTRHQLTSVTSAEWQSLILIALTTGMVAMLIYYRGLKFTQAKVSAIAELTWPLSAVFVGYYFFNERLVITQIIGAGILLISMYQIGRLQKNHG